MSPRECRPTQARDRRLGSFLLLNSGVAPDGLRNGHKVTTRMSSLSGRLPFSLDPKEETSRPKIQIAALGLPEIPLVPFAIAGWTAFSLGQAQIPQTASR
jgi:hypothetical protein